MADTEIIAATKLTQPIISIGPGRSGTTLLDLVLGEHPGIHSIGETSFLLFRLHQALMEKEDYYRTIQVARLAQSRSISGRRAAWVDYVGEVITPGRSNAYGDWSSIGPEYEQIRAEEQHRMLRQLGESFWRLMVPPDLQLKRWMFREIWLGASWHPHKISLLTDVFPDARFVQSTRHPLKYLKSTLNNNRRTEVSFEQAAHELREWLNMVRHNRQAGDANKYFEFRYEDLIQDGGKTLSRVFDFLELDVHPHCRKAFGVRVLPSSGPDIFPDRQGELIDAVDGLRQEMDRLGYS